MITRSTASATNAGHKKCSQEHGRKKTTALFECDCFDCYRSFWLRWDTSPNRLLIQEAIEKFEETFNSGEQEQVKKGSSGAKSRKKGRRKKDKTATSSNGRAVEIPASASEVDDVAAEGDGDGHKELLARKLFQDLSGIGSRLWGLWNPNV